MRMKVRWFHVFAACSAAWAGYISRPFVPEGVIKESKVINTGAERMPVDFIARAIATPRRSSVD